MDKIFIRERINVVDYENNNKGLLYTSSGVDVEGGIVNVQLESDVAGWHQLSFDIPAFLIKDGKQIQNPLLKYLFPLTKLQYTRVVKEGDEEKELILYFIVQPQDGTRDDSGIVLYSFTCIDYPRHNLSKAKNGITIGEDTIDNKRSMTPNNEIMDVPGKVIYVKATPQSKTFNNYKEMGQWLDAKPGAFATVGTGTGAKYYRLTGADPARMDSNNTTYVNWLELGPNQSYTIDADGNVTPDAVWSPEWEEYPLPPDPNTYDFGALEVNDIDPTIVQFYWDILWTDPNKTIGRYDGLLYQEGSRLLYEIFETLDYEIPVDFLGTYYRVENLDAIGTNFAEGTTAYVLETGTVWRYNASMNKFENTLKNKREAFKVKTVLKGDWSKLDPLKAYLAPNKAENYLDYILEGTGWKVGEVDKIMVDKGTVALSDDGIQPEKVELTTYLYFDNSNAYNAISELCNAFKCYARFDHVNKTVSLKSVPGEDNNLVFQYRDNLANSRITQDGEKAVSKLWVYGGEDLNGPVYIQDCNRMNPDHYLADYISLDDLKERATPKENDYAKITFEYSWSELATGTISTVETLEDLPTTGKKGDMVFVKNQNSHWAWVPEGKTWYDTFQEGVPAEASEKIKFEQRYDYQNGEWVDKGQFYHWYEPMSPFADNYILDFRYFLDRNLMTEAQVDDIKYNYVLPISRLNKKRWPLYTEYQNLNQQLLTWNATYDECKIARDAIDKSIRTNYAIYEKNSDGQIVLKETNISAYPPGANIGTTGWVEAAIVYSESDAPEVNTYADIKNQYPNPRIGDYVRVKDEVKVYVQTATYQFEDTICAYLGWTEAQIKNTKSDAEKRLKDLLFSPNGDVEARVRNEGLFQKFRDEELFGDEERAALKEWYNPPANINEVPKGPTGDPDETSTMHPYYDAQSRFVTEQLNMNDALDRITTIEEQLTYLLKKIELLEGTITSLEHSLREKYGDYLVEGVFTDDTMVWIYNLWYAGLEALELYHRPLVTYELGVVDVSGLPEYRTMTKDIYHDIVYRLNSPELVLPAPGDYCYVTDNKLGIVRERANITSTIRNLSNPSQHQITIATVDTNTEDLIGKVVTAANTIYSKEQIYNRSAIVKADGTIAQDSLSSSLDDNSGKMTIMSNNGTVLLGENGILTTDRDNALLRMQYTGKGIFSSTDGGTTWENIVNAGKISIKSLSAGSIDSNNISVSNIGHDASIIIDGKGISAINYTGATSSPTLDATKVDDHTSFFLDAQTGNAYFRGHLVAGSGDIAGWQIGKTALTKGNTGMSSSGDYAFWAGNATASSAPFWVKHDGSAHFTNALIDGSSSIDGSGIQDGSVGSDQLSSSAVTSDKLANDAVTSGKIAASAITAAKIADGTITAAELAEKTITGTKIGDGVIATGHIAANAITAGKIAAGAITADKIAAGAVTAAKVSSDIITTTNFSAQNINADNIKAGTITAAAINLGSGKFKVTTGGSLTATSGTIGGWTIDGTNGIKAGNTGLFSNGNWAFYPSGGAINVGNNAVRLKGPAGVAIYDSYTGYGQTTTIASGVTVAADQGRMDVLQLNSSYGLNIRSYLSSSTHGNAAAGAIQINAANNVTVYSHNKNVYIQAPSGTVYASSSANGNSPVKTDAGSTSSRSVKENIIPFKLQDYEKALSILKQIDMTTYNYKYNLYNKPEQYGFIIDDIEKIEGYDKFFDFQSDSAAIVDKSLIFGWEDTDEDYTDYEKIEVKKYNSDVLDKYMLTCIKALHNKIQVLEEEIKTLKKES